MKRRVGYHRVGHVSQLVVRGISLIGNRRRVMMRAYLTPFHLFVFVDAAACQFTNGEKEGESENARGGRREERANRLCRCRGAPPMADGKCPRDEESSIRSCHFLDGSCMMIMIGWHRRPHASGSRSKAAPGHLVPPPPPAPFRRLVRPRHRAVSDRLLPSRAPSHRPLRLQRRPTPHHPLL